MAERLRFSRRLPMLLAALCAALVVGLLIELSVPMQTDSGVGTTAAPRPQTTAPEDDGLRFVMNPADRYDEITERPLFNRSRRPEAGQSTESAQAVESSSSAFVLTGVILAARQRIALMHTQSDPKVRRIREGQEIGGWTLEQIKSDRVIMRHDFSTEVVKLDFKRRTPPPGEGQRAGRQDRRKPEKGDGSAQPTQPRPSNQKAGPATGAVGARPAAAPVGGGAQVPPQNPDQDSNHSQKQYRNE
jgi:general secretion pathway protein N